MWIHWPVILYFLGVKNIELRSMFESTGRKQPECVKLIILLFWFLYRNHLMLWLLFPRYTQCGCPRLALFKEGEGSFSPFLNYTHFAKLWCPLNYHACSLTSQVENSHRQCWNKEVDFRFWLVSFLLKNGKFFISQTNDHLLIF